SVRDFSLEDMGSSSIELRESSVLDLQSEVLDLDFLSLEENNMMPSFGLNYIDDSILEEEDEDFMFEYWIENIAI
ncbi:MAG: hypothetical protein COB02_18570, partial [Candidatus Cloacimonadota bacterium]